MSILKTSDPFALGLLMNEDLYHFPGDGINIASGAEATQHVPVKNTNNEPIQETVAEPRFFEYLGENNKYILILVNEPAHPIMGSKEMETLLNILKGKKQDIKDVAVLNIYKYPAATFSSLKEFFACNSIIFFGINPSQLKIEGIQANQITQYRGTKILATYGISEMLNSVEKKRVFWDEMKKL